MKQLYSLVSRIFCVLFVFNSFFAFASSTGSRTSLTPAAPAGRSNYRPLSEQMWGTDLIVNWSATENQFYSDVFVSNYAWIYVVTSFVDGANGGLRISVSKDNGNSFQQIHYEAYAGSEYYNLKIFVTGNDSSSANLYLSGALLTTGNHVAFIAQFDPITGNLLTNNVIESTALDSIYDVQIVSDWPYISAVSSPYMIGMVYSRFGAPYDSVIADVSANGGVSFTRNTVATTGRFFGSIAASYGHSPIWSNGRLFVATHEHASGALDGNIGFYSTPTYVTDAFSFMTYVDSASVETSGLARHPSLSVQRNNTANDSSGISAMIVFENDYNSSGDIDIIGMRNFDAHLSNAWSYNRIDWTSDICYQPHVNWDPVYSNFLCTYWDSSTTALNYKVANMNFPSTGGANWNTILLQYNDVPSVVSGASLVAPWPRVAIDPLFNQAVFTWITSDSFGGLVLFDREFTTVNVPNVSSALVHNAYPNPANDMFTIELNLAANETSKVEIFDMLGNKLSELANPVPADGIYQYHVNTSMLTAGTYVYRITGKNETVSKQFVVTHN